MRRLLLVRHALAAGAGPFGTDKDRPLSVDGQAQALRLGEYLGDAGYNIDCARISDARRTRETCALIFESNLRTPEDLAYESGLYNASAGDLFETVRTLPDSAKTALVIAHNPGLGDLLKLLAGSGDHMDIMSGFSCGTLCVLESRELSGWRELEPGMMCLKYAFHT